MEGTFELPEAQRDRFQLKLAVEVPDRAGEQELFDRLDANPTMGVADIEQVVSPEAVLTAREEVAEIYVEDIIREYILDIIQATREHPDVAYGASPRAMKAFLNTAKARAAITDREYAVPVDIKRMAQPILRHRLVLTSEAELSDRSSADVVDEIMDSVVPPSSRDAEERAESATAE